MKIIKTIQIIKCPKCNKIFKMGIDCLEKSKNYFDNKIKKELKKTLETHLKECKNET